VDHDVMMIVSQDDWLGRMTKQRVFITMDHEKLPPWEKNARETSIHNNLLAS